MTSRRMAGAGLMRRDAHGLSLGRPSSAGAASLLPTLYGSFPIWNARSTTPNADGAISAMADISLGLYPLAQGTGANQPIRGSGVITFDGSNDVMSSVDATLLAMGNLTANNAGLFIAGYAISSPAVAAVGAGWTVTAANGNRVDVSATSTARARKEATAANSATSIATSIKSIVADFLSGAEGDVMVYIGGALAQTLAVTGSATSAPTSFVVGAVVAGTSATNIAIQAMAAMNRSPTATERTQWDAYVAAGCPL